MPIKNLSTDEALRLGVKAQQTHNFKEAQRYYSAVLKTSPKHPDANHNLGVIAVNRGRLTAALPFLKTALEANPNNPQFWINYIYTLIKLNRLTEAKALFNQAKSKGAKGEAFDKLAVRFAETAGHKDRQTKKPLNTSNVHVLSNNYVKTLINLYSKGQFQQALEQSKVFVARFPKSAALLNIQGCILQVVGQFGSSIEAFNKAIAINPNDATAYSNRGNALADLQRLDEALASYDKAISLKPDYAEAWCNRGIALKELKRLDEAVSSYDKAISLEPDYAEAWYNRGIVLKELQRLDEALASYDKAISLKPNYAEAWSNRGIALQELQRLDEALASYDKAISLKPNYAMACWNKSFLLNLIGDYPKGWELYEWRWEGNASKTRKRNFTQPLWLGEASLTGKTILIHAEQGLGDTIQFCRYVMMVKRLGARVIFEVQPPLMALLADLEGVDELIPKGQDLPDFNYHCPLLSLPLAFKTDLDCIPASIPYLTADPSRVEQWGVRLSNIGFKIGICWVAGHKGNKGRSIPIECFYGLSRMPGVRLISLHKGDGEKDLESLPEGMVVETLGAEFDSDAAFMDTAAVMRCCDLVITNDTSVAHLSGALGVQTWVALKFVPDWRWMLDRNDSPWYPTMTLFRQRLIDEWDEVFREIESTVTTILGTTT